MRQEVLENVLSATRKRKMEVVPDKVLSEEESRILDASLRQMHTNLGHPGNDSLARAIRVTGGSNEAVKRSLSLRCDICEQMRGPPPHLPGRLRHDR